MTEPTASERLASAYDEIADILVALVSQVVTITEVKRGFPRVAITSFSAPSAYMYYLGSDAAPQQDMWGPARLEHRLALSIFVLGEKQLLDVIGKYEDSDLNAGNIGAGLYRVDFKGASRIRSSEVLPISADYGVTINVSLIL